MGVKKNDEVLVPPFSFVSTANSILYCNAIPHFVDINSDNLGIDTKKLNSYLKSICKKKNGVTYNKKSGNIRNKQKNDYAYFVYSAYNDLCFSIFNI